MNVHKQVMRLSSFLSVKPDIIRKSYTVTESLSNFLPPFPANVLTWGWKKSSVHHVWLYGLVEFFLGLSDVEEALQVEYVRLFCNLVIKNGSEVEDQRLRDTAIALYSFRGQLLKHHPVKDGGELT